MKLLGLTFTKLTGEKIGEVPRDLKINTKMDIPKITSVKSDTFRFKEEVLAIKFAFELDYSSDCAKLSIEGNILLGLDPKRAKDILKDWEKKEISEEFRMTLFNIIMRKASLRALQLEEDLNLPPHINFPIIKTQENSSKNV